MAKQKFTINSTLDEVSTRLVVVSGQVSKLTAAGDYSQKLFALLEEQSYLAKLQNQLIDKRFSPCKGCAFLNRCPFSNKNTFANEYLACPKSDLSKRYYLTEMKKKKLCRIQLN